MLKEKLYKKISWKRTYIFILKESPKGQLQYMRKITHLDATL